MRNTFLKTVGTTALAVLMIMTFAQISVTAQENIVNEEKSFEQTQQDNLSLQRGNPRALEGVWNHTNTRRNCATGEAIQTFAVMHTYMRGGTMSDWGAGNPPSTRSNGQGIWSYESR